METKKIFVFLVFVTTTPLTYSKRQFWGTGLFPDDREWIPLYRPKNLDSSKPDTDTQNYTVCETPECQILGKEFLSSMNKSIDPCEDFYEYACGGWSPTDVIPPSLPVWSRYMNFDNTVKRRIKGVLETPPEPTDILPVRQAKKWYKSCMDTESLERRGVTPIESVLMQIGGWPITMDEEEWNSDEYTWQRVDSHYARLTGSNAFWRIIALPPRGDSKLGRLTILPPQPTLSDQLPSSYRNYSGNDYVAYVKLVESAAKLFVEHNGAHVSEETLRKRAEEIVEFEKALFEIESRSGRREEVAFRDLADWFNLTDVETDPKAQIDLPSAIQQLFNMVNIKIDPDSQIYGSGSTYFKELSELLTKTPARTIVDYVHWTFVSNMLIYTTENVRSELLAFVWEQYGVKERPARWYECVKNMKMAHAAAYLFVEKYFKKTTENAALDMIQNIQTELGKKILNSNWLDERSKIIAKDKLDSMKIFLGFPDWYGNKTAVINYYKGMTVGADYFDNMLSYTRYEKKAELKRYLADNDDDGWFMDPITVNALYGLQNNMINLPAVVFQPPLFTPQLPDNVNYGITGFIVGHEMGHSFDSSGMKYGKDGNRTRLSFRILMSYYQQAHCFTVQFTEYYREEESSNFEEVTRKNEPLARKLAIRTSGENIADTTGIQAVFEAYRKLDKKRVIARLPGLEEFNEDQLFFLSFAAMNCQVETPLYKEKHRASYDPHSPAKLRVIGSVSNTKDFAKVFNCPKGSAMNPIDKCNIWEFSKAASGPKPFSIKRKHQWWETQWKT